MKFYLLSRLGTTDRDLGEGRADLGKNSPPLKTSASFPPLQVLEQVGCSNVSHSGHQKL